MKALYEYQNYREYLQAALEALAKTERGVRSRFATALNCRTGYISQIMTGKTDLSPEQADSANQFFGHSDEEADFFMLLVSHSRAGTPSLKEKLARKVKRERDRLLNLSTEFRSDELTHSEKGIFFSSWIHQALLTLIECDSFTSNEAISKALGISVSRTNEVVQDLLKLHLIEVKKGKFVSGVRYWALDRNSPHSASNAIQGRLRAIRAIEERDLENAHYTATVSISPQTFQLIWENIRKFTDELNQIDRTEKGEMACMVILDFIKLNVKK